MSRITNILGVFMLIFFGVELGAQQEVSLQVVSKEIQKSFSYNSGYELNIEGEKADVKVESWDKNQVEVYIKIAALNEDKKLAANDLEYMQHQMQQVGKKIYLRNYLKVPAGAKKPSSKYESTYIIKMPADCPVYLKSKFGMVQVKDLNNSVKLNSQFTQIDLENIRGLIDVNTRFGELDGKYLDGEMFLKSRRTDVTLSELKGKYDLDLHSGTLNFFADPNVADLKLVAYNTKIHLTSSDLQRFSYNIEASNSQLNLPDPLNVNFLDVSNDPEIQRLIYKPEKEYYANFKIVVTFSEFTLSVDR